MPGRCPWGSEGFVGPPVEVVCVWEVWEPVCVWICVVWRWLGTDESHFVYTNLYVAGATLHSPTSSFASVTYLPSF